MKVLRILPLAVAIVATACHAADALPKGVYVLGPKAIPTIFGQCSRSTPEKGIGSFTPLAKDIELLEKALPAALAVAKPNENWANFPGAWDREYVGIVRGGKRFIYGNYVVSDPRVHVERPTIVCDGGPPYFGAEWDVEDRRISHLAFNGSV